MDGWEFQRGFLTSWWKITSRFCFPSTAGKESLPLWAAIVDLANKHSCGFQLPWNSSTECWYEQDVTGLSKICGKSWIWNHHHHHHHHPNPPCLSHPLKDLFTMFQWSNVPHLVPTISTLSLLHLLAHLWLHSKIATRTQHPTPTSGFDTLPNKIGACQWLKRTASSKRLKVWVGSFSAC